MCDDVLSSVFIRSFIKRYSQGMYVSVKHEVCTIIVELSLIIVVCVMGLLVWNGEGGKLSNYEFTEKK